MSFTLQLTPDLLSVEPGASAPLAITVVNRGDSKERFEMEIEGIDPEWKAVPVPIFEADPGESRAERVFFKPPRASESAAGDYPFVVRVRSLVSGETQTGQGVLQVKPFHHLSMEVSPKRGVVSPMRRQDTFEVTLVNLGNAEHTIRLMASDPDEECTYEFESDQVIVGPGAQRDVEMVVSSKRNAVISTGRLIGVNVSGRSVDTPAVIAASQTQVEVRPLFSPAALGGLVLLALVFFGWLLARPKPCTISISVNPPNITAGQPVTVQWAAREADRVQISVVGGRLLYDGPNLTNSVDYVPATEGSVTIEARAGRDNRLEVEDSKTITVLPAPRVDPPSIVRLKAVPNRVRLGDPFVLKYEFSPSVTKATLGPDNIDLNLQLTEELVKPLNVGQNQYTVVAVNSKGEQTQKTFTVEAYAESDAHILAFDAVPLEVTPDNTKVTLSWQVTNAARVELTAGSDPPVVVDPVVDKREFDLSGKTTFVLTAIDANDRRAVKKLTISYRIPVTPPRTTGSAPGSTTAGTPDPLSGSTSGIPPASTAGATTGSTTGNANGNTNGNTNATTTGSPPDARRSNR